ncbi:unnamed protein product [Brassica oleracea]|uniref:(rape) hypothetical protein n=1 Tax=Brassica napus TaxID=3708 RepID=A0A816KXC7_BRANA|nr:unnamed protein product [Brassica napus]
MAIPVVPYTMVKLSRAVSKKQRTIRCQCLECDSSGKYKRSLFKKISNFSTWSNLTLVLLWVVIIFLIYYTKNMSREVHIAQRGAITPLIKTLQSSDEQVVEMSAFALGRLAQDTHNQAGIGQRGGIISLLNLLDENLADFIKAGGIQRLQDDNFTVQPTRDCVVRTLKRLDNKIHGPALNQLLYLMRTTEKTIQRRIDLALAHICDPKDGKLISLITMHERADILLETFNRIEKLLPVHQRTQLLPHPPMATGKKTSFFQV